MYNVVMKEKQGPGTLEYLLLSLVPYSKPNLKLVFLPHRFFSDLEMISQKKRRTLQTALYRAQQNGLVERVNGVPVLTERGRKKIKPYQTKKLAKETKLMIIFDIPEEQAYKRRKLRDFLRSCGFVQVQRSVWVSNLDYSAPLQDLVDELQLAEFVQLFECAQIKD